MKKTFCDICGEPAQKDNDKMTHVCIQPVLCDNKAKIQVRLTTGFVGHSTGFGGPPDLCLDCFCGILDTMQEKADLQRKRLKENINKKS